MITFSEHIYRMVRPKTTHINNKSKFIRLLLCIQNTHTHKTIVINKKDSQLELGDMADVQWNVSRKVWKKKNEEKNNVLLFYSKY